MMAYSEYKEAVEKEVLSRFPYLSGRPEELNRYMDENVIRGDYNKRKSWRRKIFRMD